MGKVIHVPSKERLIPRENRIKAIQDLYWIASERYEVPEGGIPATDLSEDVQSSLNKAENAISTPEGAGSPGQVLQLDGEGVPSWTTPSAGTVPDAELSESSTNAVQNKVITQELNDNYAKKDGYYESMGVGTAVNLVGQVERTNDSLYRTSGGTEDVATGTARIESIKGQTIAWNQCVNVTDGSQSSKGITMSCQDGVLSVSGAFDGTTTSVDLGRVEFKCVDTHKYYLYIPNKLMSKLVLCNVGGSSSSYSYDNIKVIKTANVTKDNAYVLFRYTTPNVTLSGSTTINIFDLTLIYGAGNEPSTPEQFEADYQRWFGKPLTYEPYDEGSLKNVMLDGLKTIGFNQWDEEWENGAINISTGQNISGASVRSKNYIPVCPNTTYYLKCPNGIDWIAVMAYDSNKQFIKNMGGLIGEVTIPAGCSYIRFYTPNVYTTYNNDICINISWSGVKNDTYEPYEENTISIPTTTMTGKLNGQGESVVIFPDGMKGVNDVHDEIYYVGGKTYAVKRIGRVDLGNLSWTINSTKTYNSFFSTSSFLNCKPVSSTNQFGNILCQMYKKGKQADWGSENKVCALRTNANLIITDSSYTDDTTFKTAMQGVYLDYELETPLVYEVDDFTLPARYRVNDWGTEEQLQASGANGIAAIISCLYGVNAVDRLRRLNSTHISIESMRNILTSMVGAGIIGSYSLTFNEQSDEYECSITAPSISEQDPSTPEQE